MTAPVQEIRERAAIALDYIRVSPLNMMDAWAGRGNGAFSDRDFMWALPKDHQLHLSDGAKDDFRKAADKFLEEIGVPALLARVEELEKELRDVHNETAVLMEQARERVAELEAEVVEYSEALASSKEHNHRMTKRRKKDKTERDRYRGSLEQLSGVIARETDCPFCHCHAGPNGWEHTSDCPIATAALEDKP